MLLVGVVYCDYFWCLVVVVVVDDCLWRECFVCYFVGGVGGGFVGVDFYCFGGVGRVVV